MAYISYKPKGQIKNAKITSVKLGNTDHDIMTLQLFLDYGGSGQAFGGYALDEWDESKGCRVGTSYGLQFIKEVLAAVGQYDLFKLPGKYIRVDANDTKVFAVCNILKDT